MALTRLEQKKQLDEDLDWILNLVKQAQFKKYYGKIILTFEDGKIRRAVREESLKPPKNG